MSSFLALQIHLCFDRIVLFNWFRQTFYPKSRPSWLAKVLNNSTQSIHFQFLLFYSQIHSLYFISSFQNKIFSVSTCDIQAYLPFISHLMSLCLLCDICCIWKIAKPAEDRNCIFFLETTQRSFSCNSCFSYNTFYQSSDFFCINYCKAMFIGLPKDFLNRESLHAQLNSHYKAAS